MHLEDQCYPPLDLNYLSLKSEGIKFKTSFRGAILKYLLTISLTEVLLCAPGFALKTWRAPTKNVVEAILFLFLCFKVDVVMVLKNSSKTLNAQVNNSVLLYMLYMYKAG